MNLKLLDPNNYQPKTKTGRLFKVIFWIPWVFVAIIAEIIYYIITGRHL